MEKKIDYDMTFCCGLSTTHGSIDYLLKYVSYYCHRVTTQLQLINIIISYFHWCFYGGNLSIYCDVLPTEYALTLRHSIFQITIIIVNYIFRTLCEAHLLIFQPT